MWTEKKVRDELPTIQIKLCTGEVITGKIQGRKLEFAQVWATIPTYGIVHTEEYAWDLLAHLLDSNTILFWGNIDELKKSRQPKAG